MADNYPLGFNWHVVVLEQHDFRLDSEKLNRFSMMEQRVLLGQLIETAHEVDINVEYNG
jgi:hypothetical protein